MHIMILSMLSYTLLTLAGVIVVAILEARYK